MATYKNPVDDHSLDQLFRQARTYSAWLDRPVTDEQLRELYELFKWGPTAMNTVPARIVFVRSPEAKEKLLPCLNPGNVDKTRAAPVTAIVAYDVRFFEHMAKLAPHNPAARSVFEGKPGVETTALRNGTLQGGYFIVAARAIGLDCGPMSGFSNAKLDQAFFAGTSLKSNFLCNLGYGDPAGARSRGARLDFDEACRII